MYISVAQILLDIQQNIWKYEFSNFCVFVKKLQYHHTKLKKMRKFKSFVFDHISYDIWVTETHMTIPHFNALDLLNWLLVWHLTLGVMFSDSWIKIPVVNFSQQPLMYLFGISSLLMFEALEPKRYGSAFRVCHPFLKNTV